MNVHEFTPVRTLDEPPAGPRVTRAQRAEAFIDAFRGFPHGRYDQEVIGVLADLLDDEEARGLVSLIERRANAAKLDAWQATPASGPRPILDVNAPPYVPGNSGPGFDS